jgi:hypothetical protein
MQHYVILIILKCCFVILLNKSLFLSTTLGFLVILDGPLFHKSNDICITLYMYPSYRSYLNGNIVMNFPAVSTSFVLTV